MGLRPCVLNLKGGDFMGSIQENFEYFKENHGEIYEAYSSYGKAIHEDGGPLDEKTKRLMKVAISATIQNEYSLTTHIRKALKAGASLEDVEHTILLVAPTVGFPAMMKAIMVLREEMDR